MAVAIPEQGTAQGGGGEEENQRVRRRFMYVL